MVEEMLAVAAARLGLAWLLLLACFTDWHARRIPNLLSVGALCCALVWHSLAPAGAGLFDPYMAGALGIRQALFGAALMFALLILPYAGGLLGAGDVKLMSAIAAWVGLSAIPSLLLSVMLSGAVLSLAFAFACGDLRGLFGRSALVIRKLAWRLLGFPVSVGSIDSDHPAQHRRLPFALAIAGGSLMHALALHQSFFS